MDITMSNFAEKLPGIIKSIETADFVTIDTEFSGLTVGYDDQTNTFDSKEERY